VFRGDTLRGLLLNAYAFGFMGQIALFGAIAAFVLAWRCSSSCSSGSATTFNRSRGQHLAA